MKNQQLQHDRFLVIRGAIPLSTCQLLSQRLIQRERAGNLIYDSQTRKGLAAYGDKVFECLLQELQPKIEKIVGFKLLPSFSYGRWYQPGSTLSIHKDRQAAQLACTVTLDYEGPSPWPIFVSPNENKSSATSISLKVGDMLIFYGGDLWHWREKMRVKTQKQALFFYLENNASNKRLIFDSRKSLGDKAVRHSNSQ